MMKVRKPKMIFEVVGGVGNQLFGLAAAVYLEELVGRPFEISMREVDKGITNHGVSIMNFKLPFSFIEYDHENRAISRNMRRVFFGFNRKFKLNNYWSRRILGVYRSDVQGLDPILDQTPDISRFQGYFQSEIYAAALRRRLNSQPIELRTQSQWLLDMKAKALVQNPIIMHVRRGDYRNQVKNFGVLGPSYYERSVSVIRRFLPENPIWIFSDEIDNAREELTNLKLESKECTWISPPSDSPPEESFTLMQYGAGHIISNSTFSWWGAYLSHTTSMIIAPRPWMRSIPEPPTLIPQNWFRVDSDWI